MRVAKKKLTAELRDRALSILLPNIRAAGTVSNLDKFLDAVFTKNEKEIILRRMLVTEMLANKVSYREIEGKLEISKITISKIKDILEKRGYGRNPRRKRISRSYENPAYAKSRKKKSRPLLGYYKGAPSII